MFQKVANLFDRVYYKRLLPNKHLERIISIIGLSILACLCVIVTSTLSYMATSGPRTPVVYMVPEGGAPQEIQWSDMPSVSPQVVANWTELALVKSFKFNFVNYEDQKRAVRKFFSEAGWESYVNALADAQIGESVKTGNITVMMVPTKPSRTVKAFVDINGDITYIVQTYAIIIYKGATEKEISRGVLRTKVKQLPTLKYPNGIGIVNIRQSFSG